MSECTDLEAQMRVSLLTKADVMPKMYMRDCTSEDTQSGFERARPARTEITNLFGGDALRGNTRSHPEHDGKDLSGRWYYAGDGMGEQVGARICGGVAQLGEHLPCKQGVRSSILLISTIRAHSSGG